MNGLSDDEDDSEEGRKMDRDIVHFEGCKGDTDASVIEEGGGHTKK